MPSLNLSLDFTCLRNMLRVLFYLVTTNFKSSRDTLAKKTQPRSKQTEEIKIHKLEVMSFAT